MSKSIPPSADMRAAVYILTKAVLYHLRVDSGREDIPEEDIRNGVANGLPGALDALGFWDMHLAGHSRKKWASK